MDYWSRRQIEKDVEKGVEKGIRNVVFPESSMLDNLITVILLPEVLIIALDLGIKFKSFWIGCLSFFLIMWLFTRPYICAVIALAFSSLWGALAYEIGDFISRTFKINTLSYYVGNWIVAILVFAYILFLHTVFLVIPVHAIRAERKNNLK